MTVATALPAGSKLRQVLVYPFSGSLGCMNVGTGDRLFTLIELLVVITIIYYSVGGAGSVAGVGGCRRKAVCLSNLKQIGVATGLCR